MKKQRLLTIDDAVDNLSKLAELDVTPEREDVQEEAKDIRFLDPNEKEKNKEVIKESFRTVHNYLKGIVTLQKKELKEPEMQRGIQAMMVLAGEAAQKIDKFTTLFQDVHHKGSVTELNEFKELQDFYLTDIAKRFEEVLEEEAAWEAEWGKGEEEAVLDFEKKGLKDLQTVKRDKDYELFYLRNSEGKPFFNRNLIRHIKLITDVDELKKDPDGEDLIGRLKSIEDKDLNEAASQIIKFSKRSVDEFYKEALRHKHLTFVSSLMSATMALMLSANPRNLMQNTSAKTSQEYFADFQFYLREALKSEAYHQFIATPPKQEQHFSLCLMNLVHRFSFAFFTHLARKKEMIEFLYRLMEKGKVSHTAESEEGGVSLWNALLEIDSAIRAVLKRYPSGPFVKTLELFKGSEQLHGFDPILQGNYPSSMYTFSSDHASIHCIRLPCPTFQEIIDRAEVTAEFKGFLRQKEGRFLLINLQDRTSWEEHARCRALEALSEEEEFKEQFIVVNITKNTPFYLQSEVYLEMNEAETFRKQLLEQLISGEICGFYFPESLKAGLFSFAGNAIVQIHQHFFSSKNVLTRKERLDFIEIFYQFLYLKLAELVKPGFLSFTCKDAIDTGEAVAVSFYVFLHLAADPHSIKKAEKDFILWMLYAPALLIRERAIDIQRLNRAISSLSLIHTEMESDHQKIISSFSPLYKPEIFKSIRVKES